MRKILTAATIAFGLLAAPVAHALEVISGQVVAVDRRNQLVKLHDGSVYYLPNRVYMTDFRGRPRATIWYRVENGVRVVVNYKTEYTSFRD